MYGSSSILNLMKYFAKHQGTFRKGITFKHKLGYSNYFGFR